MADHVPHDEEGALVGEFDGAVPVASDVHSAVGGHVGHIDAQAGELQGLFGDRQQGVLEPGGERAFGLEHAALDEDGALALAQGEFGVALRGEVLEETVHLDRGAVGVRLGLRDEPQVPHSVAGRDPERLVDGLPRPQQPLDGRTQPRQVLRHHVPGQVLQPDRPQGGSRSKMA